MVIGWIFAIIAGLAMPSYVLFFGDVFDSFDFEDQSNPDFDQLSSEMMNIMYLFIGIGVVICVTTWAYKSLLKSFAAEAANKIRNEIMVRVKFEQMKRGDLRERMRKERQAILAMR